jgi:hypothetical protein
VKTDPRIDGRLPSLEPPVRAVPTYVRVRRRADPAPTRAIAVAAGVATTLGLVVVLAPPDATSAGAAVLVPSGTELPSDPDLAALMVLETPAPSPSPSVTAKAKAKAKAKATAKPKSKSTTRSTTKATAKPRTGAKATPRPAGTARPKATAKPTPKPTAKPKPKPTPVPTGASGKP